ncbi:MAG: signal peptidase II [Candidatus Eremiobacteraeota bacterium]|nr:signal peptidase II [Candidatus Eremiobacteraeota bacterium]
MFRFWLAAAGVLALDQFTKHVVVGGFEPGESRAAIPHILYWTYVQNHRGAFGLFGSQPWVLVGMALVVLLLFWFAFRESAAQSPLVRVAFGAIVGGAIGNIVDRFHYGSVVDFIDLRWWPVFNVADSCITIGVVLLVLSSIGRERAANVPHARPS